MTINKINQVEIKNDVKLSSTQPQEKDPKTIDTGIGKTQAQEEPTDETKMTHKEAKAWVKNYMEQNGCTKKEAKKAFEKEFGYYYPSSPAAKVGRAAAVGLAPVVTGPAAPFVSMGVSVEILREGPVVDKENSKTPILNFIRTGHFNKTPKTEE